jgi:CheY-like chemotaxis protein
MKFIWIDDLTERKGSAENLAAAMGIDVDFLDVSDEASDKKLSELLNGEPPDLIIIDHNLEEIESGIFKKGSTVAAFIRERWFEIPIISVSAKIEDFDSQQRALYIDIFPFEDISKFYPQIMAIAQGFKALRENKPKNTEELLAVLGVPEDDKLNLTNILPTHLKQDFNDNSLIVEIAHWIKDMLFARPGFLYNKIWTSTLIGIQEDSFKKVEGIFEPSKYTGLFSNSNEERWWKSEVLSILYSMIEEEIYSFVKGRHLPGIEPNDYSVCHASGEPFPETVAFTDSTSDAREVPIKLKYADLHPDYETLLNFDDIRIMTGPQ